MISIIIPVYNQHEMTEECLQAIHANTEDYEIILVDNGSTPAIEGATIRNDLNAGFPVAVNQGIRAANGNVIILLNNDCVVTPYWAQHLVTWLDVFDIVAPMTNYCAGLQQVALPVYNDIKELNKRAFAWYEDNRLESQEVKWVIGFCMAFRKNLYDELGEFDESLWPCSGEELDLCLRARAAGYTVGIARDVYVHHAGSQTFKDLERAGSLNYQKICDRNERHVAEKWGEFWDRQAIEEENGHTVTIGDHSYVDGEIDISFKEDARLHIGKFCSIAKGCKVILGGNHRGDWISAYPFPAMFEGIVGAGYRMSKGDVVIGNDVWIGQDVTILSGVTIHNGAIVGAGSIVTKDVEPYSVTAGNPATIRKYRFPATDIMRLMQTRWWDWTDGRIKEAAPLLMSGDLVSFFTYVDAEAAA